MKSQYLILCVLFICISSQTVSAQVIPADSLSEAIRKIDPEEELYQENERLRKEVNELSAVLYQYRHPMPSIDNPYYEIRLYQLLYAIETAKNVSDAKTYKAFNGMVTIDYAENGEMDKIHFFKDEYYLDDTYANRESMKYKLFKAIKENGTVPLYPVTSSLIAQHRLLLEDTLQNIAHSVNVRRIEFPRMKNKMSLAEKKEKSEQLLDFIMTISDKTPFERYSFLTYRSLEKKEVPDNDVNKLFRIRYSYILYLKQQYEKM